MVFNVSARLISTQPSLVHLSKTDMGNFMGKKLYEGNSSFAIHMKTPTEYDGGHI